MSNQKTYAPLIYPGVQAKLLQLAGKYVAKYKPEPFDLKERRGNTGYIDFIVPDELKNPIVYGTDFYQRPFVSMRLLCEKKTNSEGELIDEKIPREVVITAFQRYTDNSDKWVVGGPLHYYCFKHSAQDIIEKFELLVQGKSIQNDEMDSDSLTFRLAEFS